MNTFHIAGARRLRFIVFGVLASAGTTFAAAVSPPQSFRWEEATIDSIHRAIRERRITCTQVVQGYFDRIDAYGGSCTGYGEPDLRAPSGKGIRLGALTPIADAGQLNAFANLNRRGQRSETDLADRDPARPDALEVAARLDAHFAKTGELAGPLHCVAAGIKDQFDTFDLRTTNGTYTDFADDRPPRDATAVAKLRAAGAVILGKTNMGEYARAPRSTYGGHVCNPYATDREPGASSSGSGVSVSANLATIALSEESLGSVLDPAKKSGIVGIVPTYGLISRAGLWQANLLRERVGPHSRTVLDGARVLDALVGYDPRDPLTATGIGQVPAGGYASHARATSLQGRRIGVIREFMVAFSPADRDSIRVADAAIAELRAAGAEVLESVNARDIARFGAVDDPAIANLAPGFQEVIAQLLPALDPALDRIAPVAEAFAWPARQAPIDHAVDLYFQRERFPAQIDIRALNATPRGEFTEGQYLLETYLRERGDARIGSIQQLLDRTLAIYDKTRLPNRAGKSLDVTSHADHLYRKQALQQILLKVMADNRLDALVFPHQTVPSSLIGAPPEPDVENRPMRGWNGITDISGLPAIVVPAGFTREVHDRDPADPSRLLPVKQVALPVGLTFLGRPYDEATLLAVASAYEYRSGHRRPPPAFPELPQHRDRR